MGSAADHIANWEAAHLIDSETAERLRAADAAASESGTFHPRPAQRPDQRRPGPSAGSRRSSADSGIGRGDTVLAC